MSKGFGERLKVYDHRVRTARDRVCPVCGKEAHLKYWGEHQKKWVYKHIALVPGPKNRGKIKQATYHEADR